ncbi:MAG: hypothetical protein IPQ09_15800 [Myxococcales bacterium]|nr:hypothetical protein [Myxococcales bacterium]
MTLLVAALVVSSGAVAPNVVVALMRSARGTEAERGDDAPAAGATDDGDGFP